MVEALDIIVDRCPKGRPLKKESKIIEKIEVSILKSDYHGSDFQK